MANRVEDYALLGDMETAALVGRDGSIDWMCAPRFDSGACFAAILGDAEHGRFLLAPVTPPSSTSRRYRERSLVLETTFESDEGVVTIIDGMPPRGAPGPELVRIVEGRRGCVRVRCEIVIRFDYGRIVPWVRRSPTGLVAIGGPDRLVVTTPVVLRGKNWRSSAEFEVRAGERVPFVVTWSPSHTEAPTPSDPFEAIQLSDRVWREWCSHARVDSAYREEVLRSLLTLKALTYAPTGGIVAAPTTSLPEAIGGTRNWDYRYCWLRDSTFTLYALLSAGYDLEARAWRDWLARAVAGRPEQTQILYGLAGERRAPELLLEHLPGHERSRPVRIGNAAVEQRQLDVFGEVLDAMHLCRRLGIQADGETWCLERALIDFVCDAWREPDDGIWETRGPRHHYTFSKVMCWVAVDRAIQAVECFGLEGPIERWREVRGDIHADVCANGVDPVRGCFVQHYGSHVVDASSLLIAQLGFLAPDDARITATIERVELDLSDGGLIRRYDTAEVDDGLPPGEGVFLACSFWLVDAYVLAGRLEDAHVLFDRLLALRNDVGLLAEQYDPGARRMLGNFPQALSHIALVNTARNLASAVGPARHRLSTHVDPAARSRS